METKWQYGRNDIGFMAEIMETSLLCRDFIFEWLIFSAFISVVIKVIKVTEFNCSCLVINVAS